MPTADTRSKHFMRNFHRCYAEAILTFVLVVSRYCRLLKSSASATGGDASGGQARLEAIEEEETVRMHLAALKREEVALQVGFARVLVSSSFFFFSARGVSAFVKGKADAAPLLSFNVVHPV